LIIYSSLHLFSVEIHGRIFVVSNIVPLEVVLCIAFTSISFG
jgi:hypothetical protein